jgi:peptide deformylase
MIYKICTYGDPVLREKCVRVTEVGEDVKRLVDDMLETMHAENGLGLAAQQVGRRESVCIVEIPEDMDKDADGNRMNPAVESPMVILNPRITEFSGEKDVREEGCLSFPGIYGNVERPTRIVLEYMDVQGRPRRLELQGMVARAVQHETDHLNGVLFVDKMSHVKKLAISGKLKRLSRATKEELGIK